MLAGANGVSAKLSKMQQNFNILPKTLTGRYKLFQQKDIEGQSSSKKGIFIDKKTETKVFIKINADGSQLFIEYKNQQLFYEQSKKLGTTDVVIPKPLEILEVGNYTALVMEYFPGKSILNTDIKARLEAYTKVLKFLEKINTMIETKKEYSFAKKSTIHQLITLPYFLSKNLMRYIPHVSLFLRSAKLILKFASKWTKLNSNWLCHGDINVTNVLYYKKKVILLDFASSCISHRYFDISRTMNSTWYQPEFHSQLWNQIIGDLHFTKNQQSVLKSFVVLNLLERLSQRYANVSHELFYLKRLKMMLASL